ncbi:MAG: hypothetical protein FJ379_12250 [Verrucomicrobia bacterium]|nr:hypothetical protein [Verrucomicrobiota bacterium]
MTSTPSAAGTGNTWFYFTLITVFSWGVYGILLHKGQVLMGDPVNGRYKAFLFVGIAYFLTAVLAPLFLLMSKGAAFSGYTTPGWTWSLVAGIMGAIGAFGTLLAFGAKGTPAAVMSIVFAGAPVVNALVSLWLYRHEIDFGRVNPAFYLGIVMALAGGGLVMKFKPNPAPKKPGTAHAAPKSPAAAAPTRA